ncbi:MAG: bifunctional riboflavin kinase/FMN adenylyltransferase, partial [Lachnospiraceae bacterium]|nr:bifunctional riboflavin kinase/FMN adenylyltransferase [Lachnospiraceae bacterium]
MEIIRGTKEISIHKPTAITVGKFDGVHIGHRKILSMVVKQKEKGLLPAAFTFAPSPESFFSGKPSGQLLTDSEKECILEKTGIEILIEYPMDAETAGTEAGVFLENVLAGSLNARYIAAGEDVTFGKMGKGDAGFIMREAPGLGIRAEIIEKVMKDGEIVSSTLVRSYLKRGEMEKVTGL